MLEFLAGFLEAAKGGLDHALVAWVIAEPSQQAALILCKAVAVANELRRGNAQSIGNGQQLLDCDLTLASFIAPYRNRRSVEPFSQLFLCEPGCETSFPDE